MTAMTQANRGQSFEALIDYACEAYRKKNQALINKEATPTKVVRRYDHSIGRSKIVGAFHNKKATVDYKGMTNSGKPVAFEAKTTQNKLNFLITMVQPHQREYLQQAAKMGGLAFVLVEFAMYREVYRIGIDQIDAYEQETGKKSMNIHFIRKNCQKIQSEGVNPLHFLVGLM